VVEDCPGCSALNPIPCTCLETHPAAGWLPLSHPRQIGLLSASLLGAAAYGRVLRNAELENASSCDFFFLIPKPCVQDPRIHGIGEGFGTEGESGGVTARHPGRGWRLRRMKVLTSSERIKMKPFSASFFSRVSRSGWFYGLRQPALRWCERGVVSVQQAFLAAASSPRPSLRPPKARRQPPEHKMSTAAF